MTWAGLESKIARARLRTDLSNCFLGLDKTELGVYFYL